MQETALGVRLDAAYTTRVGLSFAFALQRMLCVIQICVSPRQADLRAKPACGRCSTLSLVSKSDSGLCSSSLVSKLGSLLGPRLVYLVYPWSRTSLTGLRQVSCTVSEVQVVGPFQAVSPARLGSIGDE